MMQNQAKLLLVALLLGLGLSACDKPGPAENAGKKIDQAATDTGKKIGDAVDKVEKKVSEQGEKTSQVFDDTEITTKVKGAIFAEPGLKSLQISVDTIKGIVTLSGSVDSQDNHAKIQALAGAVQGVKKVVNQTVVMPSK